MALFYCLQSTKTAIHTHKRISVRAKQSSGNKGYGVDLSTISRSCENNFLNLYCLLTKNSYLCRRKQSGM